MKKKYYLWMLLSAVVAVVLLACVKEYIDTEPNGKNSGSEILSVEEAKAFFEKQMSIGQTRAEGTRKSKIFNPGDFTPRWDKAKTSEAEKIASVDVPITSQYQFKAIRSEENSGKIKAYSVNIEQKLVVVKGRRHQQLSQYLMTFIPDEQYAKTHKGHIAEKFVNTGDKGGYSGIVIYTHPTLGIPIRVSKYVDGQQVEGVFLLGATKEKMRQNVNIARQIMGHISLACTAVPAATRDGGEDDDDYSWLDDWFGDDDDYGDNDNDSGEDWSWFWNWFEEDVFSDLHDGDIVTPEYNEDYGMWTLTDQDGNSWWITEPDEDGYSFCGTGDSYKELFGDPDDDDSGKPHYAKDDLPETMHPQITINNCVPSIMEYAYHALGGEKVDKESDYQNYYAQEYDTWAPLFNGVSLDHMQSYVDNFFETIPFVSYQDAIENHHGFIMTDIESDLENSTHNVLIIGYQDDGNLIYMDPMTGSRHECDESDIVGNYNIVITGNKEK